jgi:uncharacterized iron-regulated membrane protein
MRKVFFWFHLSLGLLAGLIILEKCVTGIILTYEKQINNWARHKTVPYTPSPAGAPKLSAEELITKVHDEAGITPQEVTFYSSPDEPVGFTTDDMTENEGSHYFDPYTGKFLGYNTTGSRQFFRSMNHLHRWMGLEGAQRNATEQIFNAANVIFFFILLSGIYLWIPRKMTWQHFKPVLLFRKKATGKARDFNWHNVIGVWAWVPLVLIVGSAIEMSYNSVKAAIYSATDSPQQGDDKKGKKKKKGGGKKGGDQFAKKGGPPREEAAGPGGGERPREEARPMNVEGLNAALATAEKQVPGWNLVRVRMPENPNAAFSFTIDKSNGGEPQEAGTLIVARDTGQVVRWTPFEAQSLGRRIEDTLRYMHTGEIWGTPGETIALAATAGGGMLVYTGIALSLRRFSNWRKRRKRPMPVAKEKEKDATLVAG